jgi:hypothetical protein
MNEKFIKEAANALKQSFKDCKRWYEGPGYIGTDCVMFGGEQEDIDVIKFMSGLNTKQTNKAIVNEEMINEIVKKARDNNPYLLEETGLLYDDKKGKTLRVLLGESVGVMFVNDKYVPKYDVANIFINSEKKLMYVTPFETGGRDNHPWMLVAPCIMDEKLVTYFEPLAKEIVMNF